MNFDDDVIARVEPVSFGRVFTELIGIYVETIRGPYGGYELNQNVKLPQRFEKTDNTEINNRLYFNIVLGVGII